ncbi:MAG: hypothetical protein J5706_03505 [Elusimicrobiales bacterium]|nr:hypothetical protein [Elusimicrobiales bacterium]
MNYPAAIEEESFFAMLNLFQHINCNFNGKHLEQVHGGGAISNFHNF